MEQPTDVQDVRVVHFGLGSLGAAIARAVARREGLVSVAAIDPAPGPMGSSCPPWSALARRVAS